MKIQRLNNSLKTGKLIIENLLRPLRRSRKKSLALGLLIVLVLSFTVAVFFNLPEKVEAAWWDDTFGYRHRVSFTHNAALTNQSVTFTLDTAELIAASLMQADCDDTRFTSIGGELLSFDLTGTCNNATTTYEVIIPTIVNGTNVFFVYYGNPSAINAEIDSTGYTALTPSGGDPSLTNPTSSGNQEKTTSPVAYWKFDEGTGTTSQDGSSNNNDGTITGATWQPEDMCISGKCLRFDGTDDVVTVSNSVSGIQTVSFWVKLQSTSTTQELIDLNGTDYLTSATGTITATQFGTETVYVDGQPGATVTANKWHLVTITTSSGLTGSAIKIGQISTNYGQAFFDEVKVYNYARTASQIKSDFQRSAGSEGSSVVLGSNTSNLKSLSDGLVGYWKMDETSGTGVTDYSGNNISGTAEAGATVTSGKFGNSRSFNNSATGRVSMGNASALNFSDSQSFTLSAWITMTDTSDGPHAIISKKCCGGTAGYSLQLYQRKLTLWIQDASANESLLTTSTVLNTGTWYHVTGVLDRQNANNSRVYINGEIAPLETSNNQQNVGSLSNSESFALGVLQPGGGNYYTYYGNIDEARVYNRALTPSEVEGLYNWAPGPVGYWKMDENTGVTNTYDSSGYGNLGTLNGSMTQSDWVPGKFGSALDFDGSDDYISISETSVLTSNNNFTVTAWVKIRNCDSSGGKILEFTGVGDGSYTLQCHSSDNFPEFDVWADGGFNSAETTGNAVINDGNWHHLAGVRDGNFAHLYVDGILTDTQSDTIGSITATDIRIGASQDGANREIDGIIDEVKVYTYARTQKQIISDMNAGHPNVGSPIGSAMTHWKMDQMNGDYALDSRGNSNIWLAGADTCPGDTECPTWTASGKFNGGLSFDGGDYMEAEAIAGFDNGGTAHWSQSIWIKSDTNPTNNYGLMGARSSGFNQDRFLQITSAGLPRYYVYNGAEVYATGTTVVTDDEWHHLTGVFDGSYIYIYVDGRLEAKTATSTTQDHTGPFIRFSDQITDYYDRFVGTMDEAKTYAFALTAEEVKLDYNRGSAIVLGTQDTGSKIVDGAGNSPVAHWNFNEKSGTNALDTSGSNITGVLGADGAGTDIPKWVKGKTGSALNFDGSDDFVQMPDNSNLSSANKTIEFWINKSNSTDRYVLAKATTSKWEYGITVSTVVQATTYQCAGSNHAQVTGTTAINDGRWHHVAVVQSDNSYLRIFVDGVLDGSSTSFTGTQCDSDDVFYVGRRFDGFNITASIDDIKIFNYARTPAQIAYDYNRGAPVAWWKFDECQGNTVYDFAPNSNGGYNGNNGTITVFNGGDYTSAGSCNSGVGSEMWNAGTTGKINSSLVLEDDDYVGVPNVFDIWDATSGTTIAAWIKSSESAPPARDRYIFHSGDSLNRVTFRITNDTNFEGRLNVDTERNNGTDFLHYGNTDVLDQQWHHVVLRRDSTQFCFYVDGKPDGCEADGYAGLDIDVSAGAMEIGLDFATGDQGSFNGQVDDLRIYNYALSATQVKEIYNNGTIYFGPSEGTP